MKTTNTLETVAAVLGRQAVVTTWMKAIVAGMPEDAMVKAVTNVTPFGNYLIDIEPVFLVTRRFTDGNLHGLERTAIQSVAMPVGFEGGGAGLGSPYVVTECRHVLASEWEKIKDKTPVDICLA